MPPLTRGRPLRRDTAGWSALEKLAPGRFVEQTAMTFFGGAFCDRGPTARERRILARIGAAGGLILTFRNGAISYAFGDGTPVCAEFNFDSRLFKKFVALAWIRPDPAAPALLGEAPAQRYLVTF